MSFWRSNSFEGSLHLTEVLMREFFELDVNDEVAAQQPIVEFEV